MATPQCSVIIPTYNRAAILERTLEALLKGQHGPVPIWEVLVVDDGSTDHTQEILRSKEQEHGGRLKAFRQVNRKQGAARNLAMARARGELFVFLGDDIIPSPRFLERHWRAFAARGKPRRHGLIGQTLWHPEIPPSPFRTWIGEWGLQFGFRLIENPEDVPFNFFYTSNLSFSRDLYDDLGGFDEGFREYGWEDIELGYRYAEKGGMRLRYDPLAVAYHHHRISLRSFCDRQYCVGFSAVRFGELHPELRDFLHWHDDRKAMLRLAAIWAKFLARLLTWCDERWGRLPLGLTALILRGCYAQGMRDARRQGAGKQEGKGR